MPEEIGVHVASALFHAMGGLGLYLQTLRKRDGVRDPVDALTVLGMLMVALVTGASTSMLMCWKWGDSPENRMAVLGVNGLVGVGLITARRVVKAAGFGDGNERTDERRRERSPRPDSDPGRPA